MATLKYTTKEINRNYKIKVSGLFDGKKVNTPQNFELAVYLADKHREKMTNDEAFKKIAAVYNMKWRILKRNFEYVCWVNDAIFNLATELKK